MSVISITGLTLGYFTLPLASAAGLPGSCLMRKLELSGRMRPSATTRASSERSSVEENVGFTLLENSKIPRRDVMKLSHELIRILGLQHSERVLPSELSGGMRKRVSLARALVSNPEVVLFDEPTTGLDPIMIEKVDEMIVLAKQQYQITSCIISHDMASTFRIAHRAFLLIKGKVVAEGRPDDLLEGTSEVARDFVLKSGVDTRSIGRVPPIELAGSKRDVKEAVDISLD